MQLDVHELPPIRNVGSSRSDDTTIMSRAAAWYTAATALLRGKSRTAGLSELQRVGFSYGEVFCIWNTSRPAEQGEERFSVDWSSDDDSVWYLLACSRPQ